MPDNTDKPEDSKEEIVEENVDTSVDEEVVEEEKEEVVEEAPDEKPEEKPEPEFDVEEFKKTTISETQKAVMEKLATGLGLTKEEEKQVKDELIPPWEKRGENKPKSYKELVEHSADVSEWKRKKEDERVVKVQEEQEKEAKKENKRWNDHWDTELKDLADAGKIPVVKDENDPNDPGKQARIKLFSKMNEIAQKRQLEKLPPITSIKLIYYEHYSNEEPDGADAPISFGKKGVTSDNKDDYTYAEIHNKTVDQIKDQG